MRPEDDERFKALLATVFGVYGKELSETELLLWWNALADYDLSAVEHALQRHLMDPERGHFAPKPADVVRFVVGRARDRAMAAWTKVMQAIRDVGVWDDIVFDDPIIHRVVHDMGGWIRMGEMKLSEQPFASKEFIERYQAIEIAPVAVEYPPVLYGIFTRENRANGYEVEERPVLYGNHAKCMIVMARAGQAGGLPAQAKLLTSPREETAGDVGRG